MEPNAIIENGEIRCPVCGRKHGELTGGEVIKNFRIRCRGRNSEAAHYFMLNVERGVKVDA